MGSYILSDLIHVMGYLIEPLPGLFYVMVPFFKIMILVLSKKLNMLTEVNGLLMC